jgi:hypothetical protein
MILYGCGPWSISLREKTQAAGFESRVLRRMLWQVTGDWRKQQNEKLRNLYLSPDIVRKVELNRVI